jgi:DNA polymerase-3 subunit beta
VDTPDGPVLRIVATDGNRLAYAQAPYAGTLAIGRRMLVPRTPLLEVRKMIEGFSGDIEIGFSERAAVVRFEGTTVHMRLLEAEFPKYQEVMPTTFKRRVVVDRRAALDSLRRVGIFAVDKSHSVRLACSADGIVLTARKLDAGDAREELPVVAYSGEALTLGTNGGYLTDALNACGEDTVEISLCDALSPMQIRGLESADTASPSCLFIVMPVRLD